jgi:hypothetical protein
MTTMKQIEEFLASGPVAIAGVSRNPKKFGYIAFKELREKGLEVIPVNPNTDEIGGTRAYRSVADLPANVNSLLVLTAKPDTAPVVRLAREKGIKNIWIQQMSDTPEAIMELAGTDINVIYKQCIL